MKQKLDRPKSSLIDAIEEGSDSVNHVIDQAFNYLGHFDQLKRLSTHLNRSTIKHTQIKVLNGLNLGLKLEDQISEFNVDPDQNQLSPNQGHNEPMSALLYLDLHIQQVGPIGHLKWDIQKLLL